MRLLNQSRQDISQEPEQVATHVADDVMSALLAGERAEPDPVLAASRWSHLALQHLPQGICILDWGNRRIAWLNPAFQRLLAPALNERDLHGLPIAEVLPALESAEIARSLGLVADTGAAIPRKNSTLQMFDGGTRRMNVNVYKLPPHSGKECHLLLHVAEAAEDADATIATCHREDDTLPSPERDNAAEMFNTVLSNTSDRHYVHSLDGKFVYANKTMCDRLHTSLDQLVSKRMEDFPYPPEWVDLFDRSILEVQQTGKPVRGVFHMDTLTEQPEWFEFHLMPVFNDAGQVCLIAGNSRDITSQKQAEIALRQALDRLSLAVEATDLGTFDFDPASEQLVWDAITRRHWGVPDGVSVTLRLYYDAMLPEYREATKRLIGRALDPAGCGKYDNEYRIRRIADQKERWIRATGQAVFSEDRRPIRFIGTTQDITDSKEVEQRILDASKHDTLTKLPNRELVLEYGGHLLALAERTQSELAVLFIDLDRFKPVNDQYGHQVGDKVLQETARRIADCTRKADIVGRIGGDEFLVILSHLEDQRGAQAVAAHIVQMVEQPIRVGDVDHAISCSIGLSLFPEHGRDMGALVRAADLAMYAAKAAGRNGHVLYTEALEREYRDRMQLEQWLRQVVRREELNLLYQPIVDLCSDEVIGVEALLRLPYGNGVYYSPAQFISVAESAGLIDRVGTWVIEEACRQHAQWREAGLPPMRMSINVSPLQFRRKNFAEQLIAMIETSAVDLQCIEIEVTESTVMESLEQTIDTLSQIRGKGIRIALDDFGTGYSSLSQLASLPLDKLKIDQSFVKRLTYDSSSRAIAEMIIALGKTMKLDVVGEGIETEEDLHQLRELGCEKGQGYLFSIPLSADEFADWYKNRLRSRSLT